jgi:hypothetical protein
MPIKYPCLVHCCLSKNITNISNNSKVRKNYTDTEDNDSTLKRYKT